MLYYILGCGEGCLNLFKYTSFRAGCALALSFFAVYLFGKFLIPKFKKWQNEGQPIRKIGPKHQAKAGTPTMGGVFIIGAFLLSTLLFCNLNNPFVLIAIAVSILFFAIGFIDDYLKVKRQDHKGLKMSIRLLLEVGFAIIAVVLVQSYLPESVKDTLLFPVFKDMIWGMGIFFTIFGAFVVVGSSNSVNLTDGLDGLATLLSINVFVVFVVFALLVGRVDFSTYLNFPYINHASELVVVCSAMIGSLFGFYWYNSKPAEIFMGDCGALSLGALLGIISVMLKSEIVLAIAGGIFVAETLSDVIQVYYFRATKGKRFFKMAPLHHHYECTGLKEEKIVARFWIVSILLALIAIATLKIR